MRSRLVISLALLAVVIAGGLLNAYLTRHISDRYVSAAEELMALTAPESWARAEDTARAYLEKWEQTERWLQILINHDDTDDVTLALQQVLAGIEARDVSACLEACHTLRECAGHIRHRDAFTWGNVL